MSRRSSEELTPSARPGHLTGCGRRSCRRDPFPAALAIVAPADGAFGNAGRGLIRAPNVWQIDLALQKTARLTEKVSMDFRFEAFNILNHTPLGDPGNLDILGGPSFGQITSTLGYNNNSDNFFTPTTGSGLPRQIEFMLRVNF